MIHQSKLSLKYSFNGIVNIFELFRSFSDWFPLLSTTSNGSHNGHYMIQLELQLQFQIMTLEDTIINGKLFYHVVLIL